MRGSATGVEFAEYGLAQGIPLGFQDAEIHRVAALPALVGLAGDDYLDLAAMSDGYRSAMLWCAGLLAAGGVVSWFGLGRAARP